MAYECMCAVPAHLERHWSIFSYLRTTVQNCMMGSSFSSIFKRSGMCRPSGSFPLFVVYRVKNRETRWKNARKVILKGKVGPSTKMKNIPLVFGTCSSTPCWGPVLGEVERDALSSGSR